MDNCALFLILVGCSMITAQGTTLDNCPPADPNCHPTCIVYTADHCRYCMCNHASRSFASTSNSEQSTDAAWDMGFEGGDWSAKVNSDTSVWSNTDQYEFSDDYKSSADKETVKYVIVEKEPDQSYSNNGLAPEIKPLSALPNQFPAGFQSPFAGSHISSGLLPGTNTITDSYTYGSNVIHVPLLAPGIPKYCVKCRILSCPRTCERIDEYGCRSCPCAPSRYQTMPVMKDCSDSEPVMQERDCSATKLCMETCHEGYQLGDAGKDGCRSCTCIRAEPTTTPKPKTSNCFETLACMLKCKDGYLLGEKQANGCPSCKCLAKGQGQSSSNDRNNDNKSNFDNSNNKFDNNNNKWNSGTSNWNNNALLMNAGNNGSESSGSKNACSGTKANYLKSTNGIGSGKCEPPMCFDGHMSVDQAMKIGSESAGGGGGCNEGGGMEGVGSGNGAIGSFGISTGAGGMGSGSNGMVSSGQGMSNGGIDSSGMGGFGMGNIGVGGSSFGSGGKGSGSVSASGKGMPSPFSVSMSGMSGSKGGGMSMNGGGSSILGDRTGGGMQFSPFSSAMSGEVESKGRSSGNGVISRVSSVAYNTDCIGAECSAKNRMQHKDCADLVHCLVTCEGSYMLGPLDDAGCQTCSCTT